MNLFSKLSRMSWLALTLLTLLLPIKSERLPGRADMDTTIYYPDRDVDHREKRTITTLNSCSRDHMRKAYALHADLLKSSICQPRLVMKELESPANFLHVYMPNAVHIEQCGGACPGNKKCMPAEMESFNVQIMERTLTNSKRSTPRGKCHIYQAQKHNSCECKCMITETSCDPELQYFENCQCNCKNAKAECSPEKTFDRDSCSCVCRERRTCTSGHYFNVQSCRCEAE